MSKEDIMEKHWINPLDIANTGKLHKAIGKMMDDHAKEVAIGFAEWAQQNGWEKHIDENVWRNRMGYATEYTTEQLYQQYLNQRS